jgi:hypothetical protein
MRRLLVNPITKAQTPQNCMNADFSPKLDRHASMKVKLTVNDAIKDA